MLVTVKLIITISLILCTSALAQTRVGVIDTGLDLNDERFSKHLCLTGHNDFTGSGIGDTNGHGTHVVGLIQKYAGDADYCLVIAKFHDDKVSPNQNFQRFVRALRWMADQNVEFVNVSVNGGEPDYADHMIFRATPKITWVVAAGNDGKDLDEKCDTYPVCYKQLGQKNIVAVGSLITEGKRTKTSNYGSVVDAWEIGEEVLSTLPGGFTGRRSGTSMATAIHTGKLINAKTK